jgi:serine/threonine protein kinase
MWSDSDPKLKKPDFGPLSGTLRAGLGSRRRPASAPAAPVPSPLDDEDELATRPQPAITQADLDREASVRRQPLARSASGEHWRAPNSRLPAGFVLGDRFEIGEFLGGSGRTQVYAARDQFEEQPAAVKLVHLEGASNEDRARLARDVRRIRELRHPLIVDTLAFGEHEGRLYIAMEQMIGETLRDSLDARLGNPLPIGDAVVLGKQIALALAAAHRVGVVHRDVKPSQVFLTDYGRGVKLGDFGLSRFIGNSAELSMAHAAGGSSAYISPERVESGHCTVETDLWSLCVVPYEMVAGVRPYDGRNLPMLLFAISTTKCAPPSTHNALVPPALDELILQMLAKNPHERLSSAEAVAERLTEAAGRA